MEIEDNSYDGAYALESICHAKDPLLPYSEIFRVLKPGSLFVEGSWVLTDNYNDKIPDHVKIIDDVAVRFIPPPLRMHVTHCYFRLVTVCPSCAITAK